VRTGLVLLAIAVVSFGAPPGVAPKKSATPAPRPTLTPRHLAPGEAISLDLKDADLRDVLLSFGKMAGINMVLDPEVRGAVTVRLQNVPWEKALEVILRQHGFGYVLEGNILRAGEPQKIAPPPRGER
jgi:type II secretory pathway component HofQ